MKTYGGVEVYLHTFLTSAWDGGEWSASHTICFTPSAHCIGGWADPGACLDVVWQKENIPAPTGNQTLVSQPIASSHYTDWAIPAPIRTSKGTSITASNEHHQWLAI